MACRLFPWLVIISALLLSVPGFHPQVFAANDKSITIATGEWPPYLGKNIIGQGCVATLIKDVYQSQGYRVAFTFTSWTAAYERAKKGAFDASAYWFDRPDRRQDFLFSAHHITIETNYLYYNQEVSQNAFNWHDLQGKTMIVNKNYTYSQFFWNKLKAHKINTYTVVDEMSALNMLYLNRGDVTIMSERTAEYYINQLPDKIAGTLVKHGISPIISKGYLLFSRSINNTAAFKSAFDAGLALKLKDTEYKKRYLKECSDL